MTIFGVCCGQHWESMWHVALVSNIDHMLSVTVRNVEFECLISALPTQYISLSLQVCYYG